MNSLKEYITEKFKITKRTRVNRSLISGNIASTLFEYLGISDESDGGELFDSVDDWCEKVAVKNGEILVTKENYNLLKNHGCPDIYLSNLTIIDKELYNFYKKDYKRMKTKWEYTGPNSGIEVKATTNYLILNMKPEEIIFKVYEKKYGELG